MLVAVACDFGKPRPALVVQTDLFNLDHPTLTLALVTSELRQAALFRIDIGPSAKNGLRHPSQIMIDKIATQPRGKIGRVIGHADDRTMTAVNRALALWLGLA